MLEQAILLPAASRCRIYLTQHAFERWNERIGPQACSTEELKERLCYCFERLTRVKICNGNILLLDEDILASFKRVGKLNICITTFLGRLSLQPSLQQCTTSTAHITDDFESIGKLPKCRKPLIPADMRVDLRIDSQVLSEQTWPRKNSQVSPLPQPQLQRVVFEIVRFSEGLFGVSVIHKEINKVMFYITLDEIKQDIGNMLTHYAGVISHRYFSVVRKEIHFMIKREMKQTVFLEMSGLGKKFSIKSLRTL